MNAGCFGKEFKDVLLSIQSIDYLGNVITLPAEEINFEYRKTGLNDDPNFLSASFKGIKGDRDIIEKSMKEMKLKIFVNQPTKIKTSDKLHLRILHLKQKKKYGKN